MTPVKKRELCKFVTLHIVHTVAKLLKTNFKCKMNESYTSKLIEQIYD